MEEHVVADDVEEPLIAQEERRAHDRSRLILDVFFDGQDVTGVASTKDISPGGLYMNTQANIPEGAFLMVPEQENAVKTPEFQERYARGVADGIEAYFRLFAPR